MQAETVEETKKQQMGKHTRLIAAMIFVLAIILLYRLRPQEHSSEWIYLSKDAIYQSSVRTGEYEWSTYFYSRDGFISEIKDKMDYERNDYSFDHSVYAFIYDGKIFIVTKDGMTETACNASDLILSANGNKIAYISCEDGDYEHGTLYLYDIKTEKSNFIASNCCKESVVISPDGMSVAFLMKDPADSVRKLCLSNDGREYIILNRGSTPIAVSNHGKCLYYIYDHLLYFRNRGEDQLLASNLKDSCNFNYDNTEVVYCDDNICYIYKNGNERRQLNDLETVQLMQPYGVACDYIERGWTLSHRFYGVQHFTDQIYYCQSKDNVDYLRWNGNYYIDEELYKCKICDTIKPFWNISADGTRFLYVRDDSLYYVTDCLHQRIHSETIIADPDDIINVYTNPELSELYYMDDLNSLTYVDSKGKQTKIADHLYGCMWNQQLDDSIYFTQKEENGYETLYYSKHGGQKIKVTSAENINFNDSSPYKCIIYNEDGTYNEYLLRDGKMILLYENCLS